MTGNDEFMRTHFMGKQHRAWEAAENQLARKEGKKLPFPDNVDSPSDSETVRKEQNKRKREMEMGEEKKRKKKSASGNLKNTPTKQAVDAWEPCGSTSWQLNRQCRLPHFKASDPNARGSLALRSVGGLVTLWEEGMLQIDSNGTFDKETRIKLARMLKPLRIRVRKEGGDEDDEEWVLFHKGKDKSQWECSFEEGIILHGVTHKESAGWWNAFTRGHGDLYAAVVEALKASADGGGARFGDGDDGDGDDGADDDDDDDGDDEDGGGASPEQTNASEAKRMANKMKVAQVAQLVPPPGPPPLMGFPGGLMPPFPPGLFPPPSSSVFRPPSLPSSLTSSAAPTSSSASSGPPLSSSSSSSSSSLSSSSASAPASTTSAPASSKFEETERTATPPVYEKYRVKPGDAASNKTDVIDHDDDDNDGGDDADNNNNNNRDRGGGSFGGARKGNTNGRQNGPRGSRSRSRSPGGQRAQRGPNNPPKRWGWEGGGARGGAGVPPRRWGREAGPRDRSRSRSRSRSPGREQQFRRQDNRNGMRRSRSRSRSRSPGFRRYDNRQARRRSRSRSRSRRRSRSRSPGRGTVRRFDNRGDRGGGQGMRGRSYSGDRGDRADRRREEPRNPNERGRGGNLVVWG